MLRVPLLCLLSLSVMHQSPAEEGVLTPYDLRCEDLSNPLGVDAQPPRLSWKLRAPEGIRGAAQQAWQVQVADSAEALQAGDANMWDSGRQAGSEQLAAEYAGPLASGQRVHWRVRVWDQENAASAWSDAAWFEAGLLKQEDWRAEWIAADRPRPENEEAFFEARPAPLLRRSFALDKPVKRARAYATGLGYYVLHLNGQRVGDHQLDPAWTAYEDRIYYSTYDVTALLQQGENVAGIELGNGWYDPLPLKMWNHYNLRDYLPIGEPRALMQLEIEYEDGTREQVATDGEWVWQEGPKLKNSVYLGEVQDARRAQERWTGADFVAQGWEKVAVVDGPGGALRAQPIAPIRVVETLEPASVTPREDGIYIYDFGQNFAGRVVLNVQGEAGTQINLRYGELLYEDGSLNPMTSVMGQIKSYPVPEGSERPSTAWQQDTFILAGGGEETLTTDFTFQGFRYVEMAGYPGEATADMLRGEWLHTDVKPAGSFRCSNERLNAIQEATVQTLRGNIQGLQSDCPHREKFGYGGDLVADSEMGLYNFDIGSLYQKIVWDFGDEVRPNGGITETAPFVGIDTEGFGEGSGPIGWGLGHPLLLQQLYQYCGNERLIHDQYEIAKGWVELLREKAQDHVIANGIGDHESIVPKDTAVTGTAFYWYNAHLVSELAKLIGRDEDARAYAELADAIKNAFHQRFYDPATGRYGIGSQANQAIALWMGLVPEEEREKALNALLKDIAEHDGKLTTGIFGTKYMLDVLSRMGEGQTVYDLVNHDEFPGWGYMLANGATTLWEHWAFSDNTFSHNHPMFGSVSEWFFKHLAGIQPKNDAKGFDRVRIRPILPEGLDWVEARYDSVRGPISVEWRRRGDELTLQVSLPPGVSGEVHVPAAEGAEVLESGGAPDAAQGVKPMGHEAGYARFGVASGAYRFVSTER